MATGDSQKESRLPPIGWVKLEDKPYDPFVGYALLCGTQLPPMLSEDEMEI